MSKAILVMDMPRSCEQCNLQHFVRCTAVLKSIVGTPKDLKSKPDWCPLKPVFEKKSVSKAITLTDLGWIDGYNACIDEILGE